MTHPLLQLLHREHDRLALWLPVLFGGGCILYFSLPYEPSIHFSGAFVLLSLSGLLLARKLFFPASRLLLALLVFSFGFAVAHHYAFRMQAPVLADGLDTVWVRGVVENIEEQEHGHRLFLKELDLWQPERKKFPPEETPYRARITIRTNMDGVQPGDHVGFRAKLTPPPRFPAYPRGYDFARWAYFQQIGAVGFSLSDVEIRERAEQQSIHRIRHIVTQRILHGFGDAGSAGGIATSLLTGDRGAIDKEVTTALYVSGLGHLLSISGLHMAMVMAGCFFIIRATFALWPYAALRYPIKKWAAGTALVTGFLYLLLAGWPVPAQRSYLMAGLFFLAVLVDRTGGPMRPVAWAAFIVLMLTPDAILTPSFQMSFAAVIALIAAFDSSVFFRRDSIAHRSIMRRLLLSVLALAFSSVVAGSATAPFAAYHFGRYSNYGLIANMLAIPLTSLWIMPWGMLSLLLMPAGLENIALVPMHWGIDLLVDISDGVASFSHANVMLPHVEWWVIGAFSLGGLWLALWRTRLRLLGIPLMFAALLGMMFPPASPDIFVDEEGKLFAVKDTEDQLVFSSLMAGRYERAQWLEYVAQEKPLHRRDSDVLDCSDDACTYRDTVIFLQKPEALDRYCPQAHVLINLAGDAACPSAELSITRHELREHGPVMLWLGENPRVVNAAVLQGKRLWTAHR